MDVDTGWPPSLIRMIFEHPVDSKGRRLSFEIVAIPLGQRFDEDGNGVMQAHHLFGLDPAREMFFGVKFHDAVRPHVLSRDRSNSCHVEEEMMNGTTADNDDASRLARNRSKG